MATRRLARLLAAALVAVVVASAAAPAVAAAPDEEGVTRDGETVVVAINASHYDGTPGDVVVQVAGGTATNAGTPTRAGGLLVYNVSLGKLALPDGDLRGVNVTVTARQWSNETYRKTFQGVTLQHLAFGGASRAEIAGDALRLNVSGEPLGFARGDGVRLWINESDATLSGTLSPDGDWVTVPLSALADRGGLLRPVAVNVTRVDGAARSAGGVAVDPRDVASTRVEPVDAGLRVSTPLLFESQRYAVDVRAVVDGAAATYAAGVTADDGSLVASQPALARADSATVTVRRGSERVASKRVNVSARRSRPESAQVSAVAPAAFAGADAVPADARLWVRVGGGSGRVAALGDAYNVTGDDTLRLPGYRIAENGSYRLVFANASGVARVEVAGSGGVASLAAVEPGGAAGNGSLVDRAVDRVTGLSRLAQGVIALVLVAFVAIVLVGTYRRSGSGGGDASGGAVGSPGPDASEAARRANTTPTHEVTVKLVDEVTGDHLDLDGSVDAVKRTRGGAGSSSRRGSNERRGGSGSRSVGASGGAGDDRAREQIADGRANFELAGGTWRFEVDADGVEVASAREIRQNSTVTLTVDSGDASVRVVDAETGSGVADAEVVCEPDVGDRATDATGDAGRASFDDVPASASSVTVSASHDRYDDASTQVSVADGGVSATVELEPLTGAAEVEVTVDGTPVGGVPVVLSAEDEAVADARGSTFRATAGDDGVARFDGLMVGEYAADAAFEPDDLYSVRSERVAVTNGDTGRATCDAEFTYRLSESRKQRVTELLSDARALGESSGSDAVVPRYYGTVVESLLDAVERLPDRGDRFATADAARPDEVAAALLDAADAVLQRVSTAMNSKRNTDLFVACSDLPDRQVTWSGRFDVDDLFDLVAADRVESRRQLAERLESVDDRITDAQGELATLSPVREPWEELRELVREERGGDEVRTAAMLFAADGMLAAVADALDEPEVRKRLQRTVF